jgi:hypothetical protein
LGNTIWHNYIWVIWRSLLSCDILLSSQNLSSICSYFSIHLFYEWGQQYTLWCHSFSQEKLRSNWHKSYSAPEHIHHHQFYYISLDSLFSQYTQSS